MILPSHFTELHIEAQQVRLRRDKTASSLRQVGLAISSFSWPRKSATAHIGIFARCGLNDHDQCSYETLSCPVLFV
jgi:hypothetical protein